MGTAFWVLCSDAFMGCEVVANIRVSGVQTGRRTDVLLHTSRQAREDELSGLSNRFTRTRIVFRSYKSKPLGLSMHPMC
jgi:hypothetical protein